MKIGIQNMLLFLRKYKYFAPTIIFVSFFSIYIFHDHLIYTMASDILVKYSFVQNDDKLYDVLTNNQGYVAKSYSNVMNIEINILNNDKFLIDIVYTKGRFITYFGFIPIKSVEDKNISNFHIDIYSKEDVYLYSFSTSMLDH